MAHSLLFTLFFENIKTPNYLGDWKITGTLGDSFISKVGYALDSILYLSPS